jgi:hypothetical protein
MGYRPEFTSEFGLPFGDYDEAYNPVAEGRLDDVMTPRTEPCIALYLAANRNSSWVFYNLNRNSYVHRT